MMLSKELVVGVKDADFEIIRWPPMRGFFRYSDMEMLARAMPPIGGRRQPF